MKKSPLSKLSGRYLTALRIHLDLGSEARPQTAHELGSEAAANGLETLDLAKIHDCALGTLILPDCSSATRKGLTKRAESFFTEANTPIEMTHSSARETDAEWNELNETLKQHTRDLEDSNRELQQQITGRETSEGAVKDSRLASSRLLEESRALEAHLQQMVRKTFSATEDERREMCLRLGGEIVQPLLGIKLRMLALEKEIAANDEAVTKEIAIIQRSVDDSAGIIKRLVHEFSV
ncbi:MAG: hypothetical protein WCQ16_02660 [Verrucomicrobiae bacterium]